MNAFADLLYPENIALDLNVSNKMQAFAHIAALLERQHQIGRTLVHDSLCERERMGSTALGMGVGIPHARIKGLRQPMLAFARFRKAIPFDAPDDMPVSEVFLLLVPGNAAVAHLQILAELAEMLCDQDFRQRLRDANDPRGILQAVGACAGGSRANHDPA
ncbi:PTS sugar transporter subunit IIA [Noviherbaspirillum cavernae]|uniref:PTS sugar transporter subunit IIA n=1 Tax=Noviherbaspirillum cavernae TaxID=2320862 RepID=A0A418X4R2_9BURK|nr:PTS sugar transporter subunit IIA [Noviherbaspirillum cavernae]RJG07406.1 PTS sugar transporter subunit IIA [Noviherbaspirillum cavernae]